VSQAPAFAASLSTANNDDSDDGDIVFDIQIGAADITITSLATRFNASAGVVSANYVLGGYAASPTLSSWTLWDSTDLTGTGGNAGWDVTDQIFAAGQTCGVYLQDGGDGFAFGDGGGAGSVLASNTDLTILQGGSSGLPPTCRCPPRCRWRRPGSGRLSPWVVAAGPDARAAAPPGGAPRASDRAWPSA
jgi:hypothetical protein